MKKIIATVLMLTLLLSMLVSCAETVDTLTYKANLKLTKPYTATIDYNFKSDNPMYESIMAELKTSGTLTFDGKSYSINNNIAGFETEVVIVGNTVYMTGTGVYKKAALSDEEKKDALGEYGTETFSLEYFESVELEEKDGVYNITASNATEEGAKKLQESMNIGEESQIDWSNATYVIVIEDGAYTNQTLTLPVTLETMGVKISYTMEIVYTYDYESKVEKIKAPENPEKYEECKLEEIFG